VFTIIFSLGLSSGVQHFISYYIGRKDPSTVKQIIKRMSFVAVLLSAASLLLVWITAPDFALLFFHSLKYTIFLNVLGIALFSNITNQIIYSMLLGLQNFKANAIRAIISSTLAYGSIVPLLIISNNPLMIVVGWAVGYYIGTILTFIFLFRKIKGIEIKSSKRVKLKPIFYYSFPLFISGIIGYGATYVDRFTVSYFLNLSEMGIYNFSLLIVSALSILIGPFSSILLPKLSEYYGRNDQEKMRLIASKSVEVLMGIYLPIALLVAAISPDILLFIANKNYLPGYVPIIIILSVNSIFISSNILGVSLQAIRKTRIFLISSSLTLASNVAFSMMLIPKYGIDGASIAFSSIYLMGFAVLFYYSRKYHTVIFEKIKIAKILLSGFFMFAVMFLVQELFGYSVPKLFLYIVAGFFIYIIIIRITKTFKNEDLDLFLMLLSDRYIIIKKLIKKLLL